MSARRFVVVAPLGRGGFGTIYKAQYHGDGDFRKMVALKLLNAEVSGIADVVGRLRDEARILGLLRHRAIVNVDRLAQFGERWAVVMEYVEGVDLSRVVERGRVPMSVALEITAEVASALHAAWTARHPDGYAIQLMHRDIKPANIQVTSHGEIKVLDFGIARAVFSGREADTRTGVPGTVAYMAPERLEFIEGPEGDVYSLGLVLAEMITGTRVGRTSARPDRHEALLRSTVERLAVAGAPERLAEFVLTMLAYEPSDRPTAEQCVEIAFALRAQLPGEGLRSWAAREVPPLIASAPTLPLDELSGKTLLEQATTAPPDMPRLTPAPRSVPTLNITVPTPVEQPEPAVEGRSSALGALAVAVLIAVCGGAGFGLWSALRDRSVPPTAVVAPEPSPAPVGEPVGEPTPTITADAQAPASSVVKPPEDRSVPETSTEPAHAKKRSAAPPTVIETPAEVPPSTPEKQVPLTFTMNGSPSKATEVRLRDQDTGKVIRATQGWVAPGTYDVMLNCPQYGQVTTGVVEIGAQDTGRTIRCDTLKCTCS